VAEAFAALGTRPARSIIFLGVSGEEKGLLGSAWFSDHPTVPIGSIVANVNIDMIGRNAPDDIVVIGKTYSSLGDVVERAAAENRSIVGLTPADDRWPEERFFFRSDHFHFARKEIPALFFFAGTHDDYHQPSDEVELLDVDKAARVARLVFFTSYAVATTPERPQWSPAGLREVRRMVGQD
jgi:Zn-dependent M28 family amino/carboxypeptidase